MAERTRDELLDELVRMTRARDLLADTADRLIRERDEARDLAGSLLRAYERTQAVGNHYEHGLVARVRATLAKSEQRQP